MRYRSSVLSAIALMSLAGAAASASVSTAHVIARTGDDVSGTNSKLDILGSSGTDSYRPPQINDRSDVAYLAVISGWDTSLVSNRIVARNGEMIARERQPLINQPDIGFQYIMDYTLLQDGRVVMDATVDGNGIDWNNDRGTFAVLDTGVVELARDDQPDVYNGDTIRYNGVGFLPDVSGSPLIDTWTWNWDTAPSSSNALWSYQGDSMRLVLRDQASVPGHAGCAIGEYDWSYSPSGNVVISAEVQGQVTAADDEAILTWTGNSLQTAFREGTTVNGVPLGGPRSYGGDPAVGDDGTVLFAARNGSSSWGAFAVRNGTAERVLVTGESLDGLSPGQEFWFTHNRSGVGRFTVGEGGTVAFVGWLQGTGVTSANNAVAIVNTPNGTYLVARGGDEAPGTAGATFVNSSMPESISLDAYAGVLIRARVQGPGVSSNNDLGYWVDLAGTLELVAREGDVVPGLGGATILSLEDPIAQFKGDGYVVLECVLATDTGQADALLAWDPVNGLHAIAAQGWSIALDDGSAPTVTTLFVDESRSLNKWGEVAFAAGLADGAQESEAVLRTTVGNAVGQESDKQPPICTTDLDQSGSLSASDVLAFLDWWGQRYPGGEWNRDGEFNVGDILDFLDDWIEGCTANPQTGL